MQRLWEYLDEELPRAEAECMEDHLAECSRCGSHVVFEQRLLDRISALSRRCPDAAAVRRRILGRLALQKILPDWKDC